MGAGAWWSGSLTKSRQLVRHMVAEGCRSIYPNLAAYMVAVEGLGVDSGRESAVLCSSSISIKILDYLPQIFFGLPVLTLNQRKRSEKTWRRIVFMIQSSSRLGGQRQVYLFGKEARVNRFRSSTQWRYRWRWKTSLGLYYWWNHKGLYTNTKLSVSSTTTTLA
jgi:hypothetical protein